MKNKIIGIYVCMVLIAAGVTPVVDAVGASKTTVKRSNTSLSCLIHTISVHVWSDTFVYKNLPNQNYGASEWLVVGDGPSFRALRSYLWFNLSSVPIPSGSVVINASLNLFYKSADDNGSTANISVRRVVNQWWDNTLTFNIQNNWVFSHPPDDAILVGPPPTLSYLSWNVTNSVRVWWSGVPNYGLIVMCNPETGAAPERYKMFSSKDGTPSAEWPKLVITYCEPPSQPQIRGFTSVPSNGTGRYSAMATDPEQLRVEYGWDWDANGQVDQWDNNNSNYYVSGTWCRTNHTFTNPSGSTVPIRVKARNVYGAESGWSPVLTVHVTSAPNPPIITGSSSGRPGRSYTYIFTSADPDGDNVQYNVNWGDGTPNWTSPLVPSGTPVNASHVWTEKGTYVITATASDIYGAESLPSSLSVIMPKNKALVVNILERLTINSLLERLLYMIL